MTHALLDNPAFADISQASLALWSSLLRDYENPVVYTADPGAHAWAKVIVPLLHALHKPAPWYSEGWSAGQNMNLFPAKELLGVFRPGMTLLLGSQVNFARTHQLLSEAHKQGVTTVFIFDHWKNYTQHFPANDLPDIIAVPDDLGRQGLLNALGDKCTSSIKILPHLGLESSVTRILRHHPPHIEGIAVLLDPTSHSDGLGYDWQSTLMALPDLAERLAPEQIVRIKPHPRQSVPEIEAFLLAHLPSDGRFQLTDMATEALIATSCEVWGMTSIALIAARIAGKPIRSLQLGRNRHGTDMSNEFIEPFTLA